MSAVGIVYYMVRRPMRSLLTWFKTLGNAKSNLEIIPDKRKKAKVYAVVFGANNNGSRAFCKYLASKGYSLIIIEGAQKLLDTAEKYVARDYPDVSIMKVKMEEFDEEETLRVLKAVVNFGDSIRGFINTKNIMLNEQN